MLGMFFFRLTVFNRIRLRIGIVTAAGPDVLGECQVITE